ncbi:uncharacterized mitochondrial protein-like protein [Tanacetum coccineum]|uniref:Uncharacterized mitochondrial protein-like protein n=1 Tax=Tanacetum coccineum TaxID=301880 RepID=A0ABQ5EWM4_9ASTR
MEVTDTFRIPNKFIWNHLMVFLISQVKFASSEKLFINSNQATRDWYSHHDSRLFVKHSARGRIMLSLYVDDMIITGDDCDGIKLLNAEFSDRFAVKYLGGLLRYFLGIEVASSPRGYLLSQSKYIVDLFDRARMTHNKIFNIPLDAKVKYTPRDGDPSSYFSLYHTIVGSLVYLTSNRLGI